MDKWKELKIYKNLPSEEIPKSFQIFVQSISDKLTSNDFFLKESKTIKQIFRFTKDFEQSIYFINTSRVKNQKEVSIKIALKPLYANSESPFYIFDGFQLTPKLKMYYPLTQEYSFLAEHLLGIIKNEVIPFFDMYSTINDVLRKSNDLLSHYKLPSTNEIKFNPGLEKLLFSCAFRGRNREIFYLYYNKYIQWNNARFEKVKNDPIYGKLAQNDVTALKEIQLRFENIDLYKQEIEEQNKVINNYIVSFEKKYRK